MKLDARQIDAFLREPGVIRVALLFGDDIGLMRERGTRLVKAIAGATDDPFRVTELDRDAGSRMEVEVASAPLSGGRRVVRCRDVGDAQTAVVQRVLEADGPGFLLLEAPGLTGRSKLRALIERAPDAVAIGCYPPDPVVLSADIRRMFDAAGISVEPAAVSWLEGRLGADQAVTRAEIEKVILYAGPAGHVDVDAALLCVGDLAGLSLEDALFAATAGDVVDADRSLELALGEGATAVAVLRAGLAHLHRLHRARVMIAGGMGVGDAARAARPPLFFRREAAFRTALGLWTVEALATASLRFFETERASKRTGAAGEIMCRSLVLALANRGALALRRSVGITPNTNPPKL